MFSLWIRMSEDCEYEVVRLIGDKHINQHNPEQIRELTERCLTMHINFRVEAW